MRSVAEAEGYESQTIKFGQKFHNGKRIASCLGERSHVQTVSQ